MRSCRSSDVLEKATETPSLVASLIGPDAKRDQVTARAKELMDKELLAMADDITHHPEIGFKETRSIDKLTSYLKEHDFDVKVSVAGLDTAFVATFKGASGSPHLGVIVEYDALRGTKGAFHGDQHSAQGPVGIAAAVAMAEYLQRTKTPGTVTVFGTPGEEMMPPSAKAVMFKAGIFDGTDVIVRSHSSVETTRAAAGFGTCCLNIDAVKYVFSGAPAHQMMAWNGRNALEGVIHLFENIDAMRSNMRPEARIQGVITEGGAAPNVVPDRAVADFYIRYPDAAYLAQVRHIVDDAARGAAVATQTKVKIEPYGQARDGISISSLSELAFAYVKKFGATNIEAQPGKPQGFEETGTVSSVIPGAEFSAFTSRGAFHTYEMEADALTNIGHDGFVIDAQAMAAVLYDFATHPEYRGIVKKEFESVRSLADEYQSDLQKAYAVPNVPDPK